MSLLLYAKSAALKSLRATTFSSSLTVSRIAIAHSSSSVSASGAAVQCSSLSDLLAGNSHARGSAGTFAIYFVM